MNRFGTSISALHAFGVATAAAGVGLYQLAPPAAKARDSELDEEGQPLVASPVLHLQAPHLGRTPRRQQPLLPV